MIRTLLAECPELSFYAYPETQKYGDTIQVRGQKVVLNQHVYCSFKPSPLDTPESIALNYMQPSLVAMGRTLSRFAVAHALSYTREFSFPKQRDVKRVCGAGHTSSVEFDELPEDATVVTIDGVVYGIGYRFQHEAYLDRPLDKAIGTDSVALFYKVAQPLAKVLVVTAPLPGSIYENVTPELEQGVWYRHEEFPGRTTLDMLVGFLVESRNSN